MSKFKESYLAHKWIDPLAENGKGIEIGGSAHNPFGISNCINIDITGDMNSIYKIEEIRLCDEALPVDVVSPGDNLWMFNDSSIDYIINSHVMEHISNPIKCLMEWWRVLKPGGIIFTIIPHRNAAPADAMRPLTTVGHLMADYFINISDENHEIEPGHGKYGHVHVYTLESFISLIEFVNDFFKGINRFNKSKYPRFEIVDKQPIDDKVGNGHTTVLKVVK